MATKKAAQRASKPKVAARGSSLSPLPAGTPMGLGGRSNLQTPGGPTNVAAPSYDTPGAMGAVTPIAAPPVVTDPFLTPTDMANQALELASVDQYLGQVDLQATNARIDAQQKLAATDAAEGRNLEAADWNTAARGVAQSSIRDTTKAQLSADAAQSRSGTNQSLKASNDYAAGEHQRADTVVNPAINSKYGELAKRNAQDVTDNSAPDTSGGGTAPATAAPATAAKPTAVNPGAATQERQTTSGAGGYTPVVKNGKFYHYYPSTGQYIYIRDAA